MCLLGKKAFIKNYLKKINDSHDPNKVIFNFSGWQASTLARVNLVISEKPILLMRTTDMSLEKATFR